MEKDTERIQRIMNGLNCSAEEAAEVLAYDKAVDKGEKTAYDLSPAQTKVAQSYAHTGTRKPTVYKFEKKERKPNEPKREIIAAIEETLTYSDIQAESVTITNPERQIDFTFNGVKYRIVLSAPRK